ncbi:MAG: LamG domain-containing protein, partial [Acetobacteraceae bacterium]
QFNLLIRDNANNLGGPYNSGVVVSDGKWHQIVAVRDTTAETVTLYVDGVKTASFSYPYTDAIDTVGGSIVQNTIPHEGDAYAGSGSIDDVRVYNRALSASEVKQLYNLGR